MQVASLTYRFYQNKDLSGVLDLWEKHSGWGGITEQQFYDWYINTPHGQCIIVVAEDDGNKIIGQLVFVPAKLSLEGKEVNALRLSAPILHPDLRQISLRSYDHPVMMMVRKGIDVAKQKGFDVLYCLPAYGWTGMIKLLPEFVLPNIHTASYACAEISLKDDSTWRKSAGTDCFISLVDQFNIDHNKLWEEAVTKVPVKCGIVRNSLRLQWKISHHLVIEIKDSDGLVGYAAFKKRDGLLIDLLARTAKDMEKVLLASIKAMHFKNESRLTTSFETVKIMLSSHLKNIIQEIDYRSNNFQFAFACCPLQEFIDKKNIDPENWYIMPDD